MNEKLDKRTKWCYTIGATGRDMAYTLMNMFLLSYIQYTMKLTVAQFGVISIIMVICLIWDAINDPMMGIIIENSHLKLGKYRPWILIGMLFNSAIIVMLFTVRPGGWTFVIFFGLAYLFWGMTYTMNDIAYWGMLPSLSSDPAERNTLVTLMSVFICIGQFSVAGVLPILVAGNAVNAYRTAAIAIAGCFVVFQLLTFFGVKERKRSSEVQQKVTLGAMFKIFLRNDQLILAGIGYLMATVGSGLLIAFGMNFFYFEFGYEEGGTLLLLFTVMYGVGTLVSQASFAALSKRFSRKTLLISMTVVIVIGYALFLMFGYVLPKNAVLLNVIGFIIFFSQGLVNMLLIVMLNNTIEYDQVKYGERHDSIISAVRSFMAKLGGAIDQGIVTLILIISGIYSISQKISNLEIQAGSGEIASDAVLTQANGFIDTTTSHQLFVLRLGIVLIPVLTICIATILLKKKYIIDEKKYEELVDTIQNKKDKVE